MKRNMRAQSTLEYLLVLAAVIGLIIFAAATWIKPNVNNTLNNADTAIKNAAAKI